MKIWLRNELIKDIYRILAVIKNV